MNPATLLLALLLLPVAEGPPRTKLLDFHAEWCPPCKQMRPEVAKLRAQGVPVRSVDIDAEPDLAARYKVTGVPAFVVVDPDGKSLARTEGYQPAAKLAAFFHQARAATEEDPAEEDLADGVGFTLRRELRVERADDGGEGVVDADDSLAFEHGRESKEETGRR